MTRGFAIVERFSEADLTLPTRATKSAAGYDLAAATDFTLPSIWHLNFIKILVAIWQQKHLTDEAISSGKAVLKPYLVPTGIKAYMNRDEVLILANRSSNPLKRSLILPNGVGVIDADYVDNPKNEGEIFVQMMNFGLKDVHIKKGERIAQGIFMPYLLTDNDDIDIKDERTGGFGSSGK